MSVSYCPLFVSYCPLSDSMVSCIPVASVLYAFLSYNTANFKRVRALESLLRSPTDQWQTVSVEEVLIMLL